MWGAGSQAYGQVPVRVVLRGEPDGWHYVLFDRAGSEQRVPLGGGGAHWQTSGRHGEEPPWWRRHLAEVAESLRERVETAVADRCFELFGVEAHITWLGVDEPILWEGLVTLREPDPARFPGGARPFVVTLQPGRGALLPSADLLFDTCAQDAWAALEEVARACRTPPPRARFLCGWTDHRSVRVGRGLLAVSTERRMDGVDRVGEIYAERPPGWSGNPRLRLRLDGIDLLDEPAEDVLRLLLDLGHAVVRRGRCLRLPELGLTLYERHEHSRHDGRFAGVSLTSPNPRVPHLV
ncbi:hypothetical protein Tcur_3257 [Thermomonospora curvata DSM 43183]|uniref:Uncharacterized protein n=2 Tax=Thermomonospora curvata TaxID=2020 RepID=D1AA83_THECD|nr:hypothetical protein [Thermomonospora sp. CIF 1]ACY98796.1 hypothetical protein Tcur_3257 [Thermomonospora curvata DSM 43183]PKK13006.1 MAG: hypothetical protein BUE48_015970 [Thermomonospora sp. CIF 1]